MVVMVALAMVAVLTPATPARAAEGPWMSVGVDDPRGYTPRGFFSCLQDGDQKSAFRRMSEGVDSYKQFAAMVKADPALRDIRSFELVRVTIGGGTATLEARTKDGAGRVFPVSLHLLQSPGGDGEGWTIAAIATDATTFPAADGRGGKQPNR